MKFLIICALFLSALNSFAVTRLQCDPVGQLAPIHQRFIISLDGSNRITKLRNTIFSEPENKVIGYGAGSFKANTPSEAIAYEAEDGTYVYNYQLTKICPATGEMQLTEVMVILSEQLQGSASVQIIKEANQQVFDFQLNCIVK